jgi:hypothetical protein
MSSVVTGREFGGVLVRLVADLAVFLRSRVVDVVSDGLTLAVVSGPLGRNLPLVELRQSLCAAIARQAGLLRT